MFAGFGYQKCGATPQTAPIVHRAPRPLSGWHGWSLPPQRTGPLPPMQFFVPSLQFIATAPLPLAADAASGRPTAAPLPMATDRRSAAPPAALTQRSDVIDLAFRIRAGSSPVRARLALPGAKPCELRNTEANFLYSRTNPSEIEIPYFG